MIDKKRIKGGLAALVLAGFFALNGCHHKIPSHNTYDTKGFSFIVFSDTRLHYSKLKSILRSSKKLNQPDVKFLIGVGDIGTIKEATEAVQEYYQVPCYPVRGNHEAEEKGLEAIEEIFPKLPNVVNIGPTKEKGTIYSFDYGNSHFIVLDCYYEEWEGNIRNNPDIDDPSKDQYDWLKDDLQRTKKEFKFAFVHEPAYPQKKRHLGDSLNLYKEDRDAFWQLLAQHNVTALFVGHTHYYSKFFKDGVYQVDAGRPNGEDKNIVCITVNDDRVTFKAYQKKLFQLNLLDEWTVKLEDKKDEIIFLYDQGRRF